MSCLTSTSRSRRKISPYEDKGRLQKKIHRPLVKFLCRDSREVGGVSQMRAPILNTEYTNHLNLIPWSVHSESETERKKWTLGRGWYFMYKTSWGNTLFEIRTGLGGIPHQIPKGYEGHRPSYLKRLQPHNIFFPKNGCVCSVL